MPGGNDETVRESMLRMAAEQGDTRAALLIAAKYHRPPGWGGNMAEALRYYRLAATSNDPNVRACAEENIPRVEESLRHPVDWAKFAQGAQERLDHPPAHEQPATRGSSYVFDDSNRLPAPASQANVPPAAIRQTIVPTLPSPEMVLLDGIVAAENFGGYSFSYGMGQLMVDVYGAKPRIGGSYMVRALPIGEWLALMDRQGFVLPVAVQKLREDAYYVRVDPTPLQGVRTLASMAGY